MQRRHSGWHQEVRVDNSASRAMSARSRSNNWSARYSRLVVERLRGLHAKICKQVLARQALTHNLIRRSAHVPLIAPLLSLRFLCLSHLLLASSTSACRISHQSASMACPRSSAAWSGLSSGH